MNDEVYMKRCLELAIMGLGNVSPNPMVGCVIVNDGVIIGEGFHQKIGAAHAEVNAINDVISKYGNQTQLLLKNASVYVNLEPCAHFGKTPPCADLLVKHQVKKVVIGNTDPFLGVNGKGIEKLKSAGIEVKIDVLAEECAYLNRRFFTRIIKKRPFLILKWAQTADGFFASHAPIQQWITGDLAKQYNHQWRNEEDAILIGKNTALIDNPHLTARVNNGNHPIRIVIDKDLSVPATHHVFNDEAKTIIFNELKTDVIGNIHFVQMEDMQFYLPQKIAFQLYLMDIQSVIIEGGASILNQFIEANLWDEARVFTSNTVWDEGIPAPKIAENIIEKVQLNNDLLTIYNHKE
jgi:diaminohydroxyphosphoribosylaminopyrimidine deaminase/5-amino-6-(5-phosphoribosylamino)uracil reductase